MIATQGCMKKLSGREDGWEVRPAALTDQGKEIRLAAVLRHNFIGDARLEQILQPWHRE